MSLILYLSSHRGRAVELACGLGLSTSFIWQIAKGKRPAPAERCAEIERLSGGEVSRQELRPDDWAQIWPELVGRPLRDDTQPAQPDAQSDPAPPCTHLGDRSPGAAALDAVSTNA
jgi:DNA-binding transcriptional regulator YdaS (Cro superfamily)